MVSFGLPRHFYLLLYYCLALFFFFVIFFFVISFPFDASRAKKIYIHLRYRFAQVTSFKTRNVVYIVELRRFRSMLFERSTHDVICIEIAKIVKFANIVFDTSVSFTFSSKTHDPLVAKNGSTQVNNTNFNFLIINVCAVAMAT